MQHLNRKKIMLTSNLPKYEKNNHTNGLTIVLYND